jgi:GNAT superfamily N-acetyltransferase
VQLRVATIYDIPAMHRVRTSVRENRLSDPSRITESDYVPHLTSLGRGWVVEIDGAIVGLAIGRVTDGNIWALFVDPEYEGRGIGTMLHDAMVNWLFDQGLQRLWLSTEPGTRAEQFYLRKRWMACSSSAPDEGGLSVPALSGASETVMTRLRLNPRGAPAHTGSCQCGAVMYEVHGELKTPYFCHCSRCRKNSGSAFTSNAVIAPEDFVVVKGKECLKSFTTDTGINRVFCAECGSPIMVWQDDQMRLRLGSLDTALSTPPEAHIFVASRAEWFEIHDDLPKYAGRPKV